MAYPLSPALTAARARLQSGEHLTARDVWESDAHICRSAAHLTLTRWHAQGLTHIAEWRRYSSNGMPAPVYAWGEGKDAPRPRPITKAECTRRWRAAHPDLFAAQLNRMKARRLAARPPRLEPLMAALLGARA